MMARLRQVDLLFFLPVAGLLVIGIGMVFSASFVVAHNEFGDDTYFLVRHLLWIALGLILLVVVAQADYVHLVRFGLPAYLIANVLLIAVLVPGLGATNYGASRWLAVAPGLGIQPSEFAKLALVLYLAQWTHRAGRATKSLVFGTVQFACIVGLPVVLVALEPDLGTTIVLLFVALSIFVLAGANVVHVIAGICLGSVGVMAFILTSAYRAERVRVFLNPWADPSGSGWHTTQALIALGSGGLSGLGLGASRQKYYFVPNAHTDSIYAIIGEEIGLVGTVLVLALFVLLAWRGLTIAAGARDVAGRGIAAGATLLVVWQGLLNMAVVSTVVPNTGVPLPFVSYGGSSMVVCLVAVGLVLSVSRSVPKTQITATSLFEGQPVRSAPVARKSVASGKLSVVRPRRRALATRPMARHSLPAGRR